MLKVIVIYLLVGDIKTIKYLVFLFKLFYPIL